MKAEMGLVSVTFRRMNINEVFAAAERCGLTCIEWGGDIHAPKNDAAKLKEIASLATAYSIKTCSYGSYYRLGTGSIEEWEDTLKAAQVISADTVRIWSGSKGSADVDEGEYRKFADEVNRMCVTADGFGISVATEYHNLTYTDTGESTLKLLNDCPHLRTYWQEQPERSFEENLSELRSLGDNLRHIHVFNFNAALERFPLKEKEERWREYVRAAGTKKYLFEFVAGDSVDNLLADAETLRCILREAALL